MLLQCNVNEIHFVLFLQFIEFAVINSSIINQLMIYHKSYPPSFMKEDGGYKNIKIEVDNMSYCSPRRMFIISTAAFATEVPGPKIAATPAL